MKTLHQHYKEIIRISLGLGMIEGFEKSEAIKSLTIQGVTPAMNIYFTVKSKSGVYLGSMPIDSRRGHCVKQ